jgi:hypothetical protein
MIFPEFVWRILNLFRLWAHKCVDQNIEEGKEGKKKKDEKK